MTKLKIYKRPESPLLEMETDLPLEIAELMDDAGITYRQINVGPGYYSIHDDESLDKIHRELKKEAVLDKLHHCSAISVEKSDASHDKIRLKYLSEFTLEQAEAFLILDGKYQINLHLEEKVIQLRCEKGDFIIIPANVKRWMDIGEKGKFSAVKCTEQEEMAAICYTGSNIADRFPRLT